MEVCVVPNEIVKHHSELNTIPFRFFSPVEMNLFFSIVSRMRDKGTQTVRFSFVQLKELSNYKATSNKNFLNDLRKTYSKLLRLSFGKTSKSGLRFEAFVMFTDFDINGDADMPYVDIKLHEKALPLLNELDSWVRYSLQQFNELQSGYSKTMFRLLKQFRTTGYVYFQKEDLHELLCIPSSYNQGTIDQRVFSPIRKELTPLFRGLTIKKKYEKGRGKPVVGYQFTFKAERKNADDFSKGEREDLRQKLFNIEHNSSLSLEEKNLAKDKLMNLKLGTHDLDLKKQQEKERSTLEDEQLQADVLSELRNSFN
jgi:plasmid replication initiation protein